MRTPNGSNEDTKCDCLKGRAQSVSAEVADETDFYFHHFSLVYSLTIGSL